MRFKGKVKNLIIGCIMNKSINKNIILGLIFLMLSLNLASQESYIKDRWDVKIGYSMPNVPYWVDFINKYPFNQWNLSLEGNYGFSECFTGGLYVGFSDMTYYKIWLAPDSIQYIGEWNYAKVFSYGVKINFHILPIFIKNNDFRFDLYLTGRVGGYYFNKNKFEYNTGVGFAFYPGKHFGFYTEYSYGNYMMNTMSLRGGIVIKFNQ